ncbi:hypothetical protein [Edwardsiella tarda]
MKRRKINTIVFSKNWVHQYALSNMSGDRACDYEFISNTASLNELIFLVRCKSQENCLVVLDLSPRCNVSLIMKLRSYHPRLMIIFTQREFLFSDRVVSEYFGGVLLKEYDIVFSGFECGGIKSYYDFFLSVGVIPPIRQINESIRLSSIMICLESWLSYRLAAVLSSDLLHTLALKWFLYGNDKMSSMADIAKSFDRSRQVIYHHRASIMRKLKINNYSRDFLSSLTIS